jgi:hypothetical protein
MRRAVLGLVVGGLLLGSAAACGTAKNPAPGAGTPGPVSLAPEQAHTKASCEAIGTVYTKNMGAFAESLSKMVGGGTSDPAAARKDAQQKLSAFGAAIRQTTQGSGDAQLRADGKQAADQLQTTSANDAFFTKIKTTQDVTAVLSSNLKEWLAPVTHHCS